MKIKYDPEADAIYIKLKNDKIDHTKELDANTIIDYNLKNEVVGVELLFVKENNPGILKNLSFENLESI
jgi:uncharacterized protein YuzE